MPSYSPVAQFFFNFLFWLFPLQLTVWFILSTPTAATILVQSIAWGSAQFYSLFINDVLLSGGTLLHSGSGNYLVVDGSCTGLTLFATVAAVLLAYPTSWKNRTSAVITAFAALQSWNILRIGSLFFLIEFDLSIFQFFHLYIWQPVNLLFSLVLLFIFSQRFDKLT